MFLIFLQTIHPYYSIFLVKEREHWSLTILTTLFIIPCIQIITSIFDNQEIIKLRDGSIFIGYLGWVLGRNCLKIGILCIFTGNYLVSREKHFKHIISGRVSFKFSQFQFSKNYPGLDLKFGTTIFTMLAKNMLRNPKLIFLKILQYFHRSYIKIIKVGIPESLGYWVERINQDVQLFISYTLTATGLHNL